MKDRPNRSRITRWPLAILLPPVAAVITAVWTDATFISSGCTTGPGAPTLTSLIVLVAAIPMVIGTHVHMTTGGLRRAWAPMLVSTVLACPLVLCAFVFCLGAHQCFE